MAAIFVVARACHIFREAKEEWERLGWDSSAAGKSTFVAQGHVYGW